MTELPEIPEPIRERTSVARRDNGDLVITCRPQFPLHHQQVKFINALLGPDEPVKLAGLPTTRRHTALTEMFGNMVRHHRINAPGSEIEVVISPNGAATVTSRGYLTADVRDRLAMKFEVAQALTPAQAADRVERMAEGSEFENHTDVHGEETGGMGLMIQRAYAEGDLHLTFFPDDRRKAHRGMERFELKVELTKGRGVPTPAAIDIDHQGPVRGFFPHVVSGTGPR